MIFEKIRERLARHCEEFGECTGCCSECDFKESIRIVNEVETEYNNGWVPCSERLPETNDAVNIVWVNRKPEPYYESIKDKLFTTTGHYHKGKWYWYSVVCKDYLDEYGNSSVDEVDEYIDIIAWQPLPQLPKGE